MYLLPAARHLFLTAIRQHMSFLFSFWISHVESSEPSGTTQPLLWVIRLLMCKLDDHLCTIYVPNINKF
eukprot:jgi/Chrzof1/1552/Cz10g12060.t1